MKKLLTLLFLVGFSSLYSQALVQTYTDRCTGETKVFTVQMGGQTTVVFYDRAKTFTSTQFQNGELRAWLEETYLWWSTLNPCSTAQTQATTTQAVTQQTTQAATQAATAAVPTVPASPPPTQTAPTGTTANTGTTNTATNDTSTQNTTGDTSSSSGSTTGDTSSNSDTSSSGSGEGTTSNDSGGTSEGGSSDGGSTEGETKTEETKTEETKTEETKSEEKSEEVKEEKSEESKEETKEEKSEEKEEKKEEEKSDEEKEKEKEEKKKEEEKKKKKEARQLGPPIITANTMAMQGLDGTFSYASTFGVSRSSLMGDKTYGVNTMIWSNLQQFMLNATYTQVHVNKEGRVSRVYSASIGGAKMFTTVMGMMNHSMVFLGKKGSAAGFAVGNTLTSIEFNVRDKMIFYDEILLGSSITGFYTKPIPYGRFTFAPMLAISSPFLTYELSNQNTIWNTDLMLIGGVSTTFNLTKRFGANLGVNAVESTNPTFPTIWSFTIGSRFSF